MSWHSFLVKGLTLGIINYETGNLIVKDPVTGVGNLLKQTKDVLMNDFDQGVWIGKRPLQDSGIGFSTYLLESINLNVLHYVVRIDGQNWHLCQVSGSVCSNKNVSGSSPTIYVGRCYEPNNSFEWFYKGKTKYKIKYAVDLINKQAVNYNVFELNCQDVAKALYYYARFGSIGDVIVFLFPKEISDKILKRLFGVLPGTKTLLQICNMILP